MSRRPAALLPTGRARLVGYALLAGFAALQWSRFVADASTGRALLWVMAATATGALVLAARGRPLWQAAAAAAGLVSAVIVSGLDLTFLEPNHVDELAGGLGRGIAALNTVRLPYTGSEPWVLTTVQLAGAAMCWAAAVLSMATDSWRWRVAALLVLVTMAASPIVSIGVERPTLLGVALAVLVAAFLWLERLARRPGFGVIALGALVLVAAVPLGTAADREEPWFDFRAFSERISGGIPVAYSWDHDYGPIDWPRDGLELFRVESNQPRYYKADLLPSFQDDRWTDAARSGIGDTPADDLPAGRLRPEWMASFRVALRSLRTDNVVGAGTVLDVTDATRDVEPDYLPGLWTVDGNRDLAKGDSYRVRAYVPRPSPDQLAAATVGEDARQAGYLRLDTSVRPDARADAPSIPTAGGELHADQMTLSFPPFERRAAPSAYYPRFGLSEPGGRALARTAYTRTWRLAQRLRRRARSPYDYLLRVNDFLSTDRFVYTEVPDPPRPGVAPLESFLFDSQRGYCQQFSGAMALLLRMGGIPSRVATGFSPGGQRSSDGDWVIRDTDAHSWVEAWFDGIGWVTFDPTPPETPARSLVAALDSFSSSDAAAAGEQGSPIERNPRQGAARGSQPLPDSSGNAEKGGAPWGWIALVALLLLLAAVAARARRRGPHTADAALAELERALRRTGRSVPAGTTLFALERRLGLTGDDYLGALRAARFRGGGSAAAPSPADRAAFRRQLAAGLGWGGRLRALYALPPSLPLRGPR